MGYWKNFINDSGLELEFDNAFDEDTGGINKENYFLDPESDNDKMQGHQRVGELEGWIIKGGHAVSLVDRNRQTHSYTTQASYIIM